MPVHVTATIPVAATNASTSPCKTDGCGRTRRRPVAAIAAPKNSPNPIASLLSQLVLQPRNARNASDGRPRCSKAAWTPMNPSVVAKAVANKCVENAVINPNTASTNHIPTLAWVSTIMATSGRCPSCALSSIDSLERRCAVAAPYCVERYLVVGMVIRLGGAVETSEVVGFVKVVFEMAKATSTIAIRIAWFGQA